MLTDALDSIPKHQGSGWQGWSSVPYFRYFLEWMLYGFGHAGQPEPPEEPGGCHGASDRLAQVLDLALWQQAPYDYLGDLLAQNSYGKGQGFFATPHSVAEFLTRMTLPESVDARAQTVCDPCVGTGRLLLHASNHSLRLYGMDIDPLLCLATLVNGYLYAPWLVKPLPFLDGIQYEPKQSAALFEAMANQSLPHQQKQFLNTEHDAKEQWRFEPIKKRRQKNTGDAYDGEIQQGISL